LKGDKENGNSSYDCTTVGIGKFISRTPEVWHGLPVITGTRVTVMSITSLHLLDGMRAEEIAQNKHLTRAQVHAALAYYYANQQQMDKEIAEEQAEYDKQAAEARPGEVQA
jgi:uncharacterized protein (DUF433 family)